MVVFQRFCIITFCAALGLAGCKTASQTSEEKAISIPSDKDLTLETWIAACERNLNDPVNGATNKAELVELTGSADCKATYPAIRKIVDQFNKTSAVKK